MKLNKLLQRLEIFFWTAVIGVIDNRRKLRIIPILLMPGMCLLVGMIACACSGLLSVAAPQKTVSSKLTTPKFETPELEVPRLETPQYESPQSEAPRSMGIPSQMSNGQRNILLVLVDRMTGESPRLQSVWLLACLPSTSHVTFLPLFPDSGRGSQIEDEALEELFKLDAEGSPARDFLSALAARDIWWHHYLVLDNLALAGMVELIGGVDLGWGEMSGTQVMRFLSQPNQEPRAELMGQALLVRELCNRIPVALAGSDWEIQFELLSGHISSDLDLSNSNIDWVRLRAFATALSCEFPTLPEIALSQPAN
jgi:hypothetical protein